MLAAPLDRERAWWYLIGPSANDPMGRNSSMHSRTHRRGRPPTIGESLGKGRAPRREEHEPIVLGQEPSWPSASAVVAGFDGTSLGLAAVVEAGLRAGPLGCVFVVHAYQAPPRFLGSPYFQRRLSRARSAGQRLLDELWGYREALPESQYVPELIAGRPAEAINRVAAARAADAIVIGLRRERTVSGLRRSVAGRLLRTAPLPVIALPERQQP
jgi:nucleotide-binding universal stress UspA family protein